MPTLLAFSFLIVFVIVLAISGLEDEYFIFSAGWRFLLFKTKSKLVNYYVKTKNIYIYKTLVKTKGEFH